jgi:hypothetical protein
MRAKQAAFTAFTSFQDATVNANPDTIAALAAWAVNEPYKFLRNYTATTPPICRFKGC